MRIGMLVDVYKPHVSGITTYIDLSKQHLENSGHEVYVFTFGRADYSDGEPRVFRSPGLPLGDSGYYFSLRYSPAAQAALQTMDVAHVHHPFVSGRLALRYARPPGIPIVFTNHTRYDLYAHTYVPWLPHGISESLLRAYMPSFCDSIDLVVSPSPGMEKVLRKLGVTGPIEVVPNGVALEPFLRAKPLPREKFGWKQDEILLVYAGRVAGEKNMDFLLQAFARVAVALDNVHLLIVGGGQKKVEHEIRSLAAELNLGDRVRFTGMVPYAELPSYLAMCDIFVTASVTEVHPLTVIEAMAAGLSVVGIDSPGVGDTIEDGKTGLLSSRDLDTYVDKLTRLCLDRELIGRMGDAARQASRAYSIERTTGVMLQHYERLVREPRPNYGIRPKLNREAPG